MLLYKLWIEKVRTNNDVNAKALEERVLSSLKPSKPYSTFSDKLRACLPYVNGDSDDVVRRHLESSFYLKKSCADFIECRRAFFGCVDVNVDDISESLDFFDEEVST